MSTSRYPLNETLHHELNPEKNYVVYCRSGKRSAVAALLLKQYRLNAVSLKGGINAWPYKKTG